MTLLEELSHCSRAIPLNFEIESENTQEQRRLHAPRKERNARRAAEFAENGHPPWMQGESPVGAGFPTGKHQ